MSISNAVRTVNGAGYNTIRADLKGYDDVTFSIICMIGHKAVVVDYNADVIALYDDVTLQPDFYEGTLMLKSDRLVMDGTYIEHEDLWRGCYIENDQITEWVKKLFK